MGFTGNNFRFTVFNFVKNHATIEIITYCKEEKDRTVYFGTESKAVV